MIRVVFFLLIVALIAMGFAWVADRPGEVVIIWMGYRIETSLMVAVIGAALIVLMAMILWSALRTILISPQRISLFFRHRRSMNSYQAISRGLIAVAAGDLRLAKRSADDAERLSPDDPLTLLLTAQSAQLAGNRADAERVFHEMARRDETKLLGLRGLYIEAQRRNDAQAARRVAEEAAKTAPSLGWANQAVLDDRCAASDWSGALAALENMKGVLDKYSYRRRRAVLLTARAIALDGVDHDMSHRDVLDAIKLAPDLVPAAALAGRQLSEKGEQRKARRILEKAWIINPHPDLAEAYANLRVGDSAREKLVRMQKLAVLAPSQFESALAVARTAINAREFATARAALAPYLSAPTRQVAILMAELEEMEHGDHGRVREWMSRAIRASGDPKWIADGVVSDHWLPVSPSGHLDGFQWRMPFAEIEAGHPVIDNVPASDTPNSALSVSVPIRAQDPKSEVSAPEPEMPGAEMLGPEILPEAEISSANSGKFSDAHTKKSAAKVTEPITPLVHAPDDPGPDADFEGEENSRVAPTKTTWR